VAPRAASHLALLGVTTLRRFEGGAVFDPATGGEAAPCPHQRVRAPQGFDLGSRCWAAAWASWASALAR